MNIWYVGAQPDPKDRRRIEVEDWGSARIAALFRDEVEIAGVTDLLTGEDIVLQRVDCGLGQFGSDCRCAMDIVPALNKESRVA